MSELSNPENSECPHCKTNSFREKISSKHYLVDQGTLTQEKYNRKDPIPVKVFICQNCSYIKLFAKRFDI